MRSTWLLAALVWLGGCTAPAPAGTDDPASKRVPAAPAAIPSQDGVEPGRFLRRWALCGPLRAGDGKTPDDAARRAAFDRELAQEQTRCAWRAIAGDGDRVDIARYQGGQTDAAAYAATDIELDAPQTVLLGLGSDDAVKVWLNGEVVHENWVSRALTVDEDIVLAPMRAGRNRLLVKVYNRSQDWGFSLRALDIAALPADRLLLRAAARREARLVELLLAHRASPDAREPDGWTALHSAAAGGDLAVARLLLAAGAKVDARALHGLTPLHVAQRSGHQDVAAALVQAGADRATRPTGPREQVEAFLRVRPLFADVVGGGVLVIDRGKVILEQAFGHADLEESAASTSATNFRLASVTKQFTAMAVMILVDRRRLSLDDTLDRLFPGFPAYGARIAVRHLLDHTSGLPDYEDLIPEGTTLQLQDRDVLQLLLATEQPVFAPGTRFAYSNSGYALLALIVERASGVPFARFLADEIFRPLGMKHTVAFENGLDAVAHRAYGYQRVATGWRRTDQSVTSAVLGDGGIYSSLDDMARWVRALDSGRLLGRAAHRQMIAQATVDPDTRYGFGWFVDTRYGQQRHWHTGSTIGFTNFVQRFPARRAAVIVLTNERGSAATAIGERIADMFLGSAGRASRSSRSTPDLHRGEIQ